MSDATTLETCEKCLNEWEALEIDDGLVYAGLAKQFLETIVHEAKAFAERAAPFLVKKDALSAELRGLAELVCEGRTLELVDDTLLDSRGTRRGARARGARGQSDATQRDCRPVRWVAQLGRRGRPGEFRTR